MKRSVAAVLISVHSGQTAFESNKRGSHASRHIWLHSAASMFSRCLKRFHCARSCLKITFPFAFAFDDWNESPAYRRNINEGDIRLLVEENLQPESQGVVIPHFFVKELIAS